jgi:hypothetical protein
LDKNVADLPDNREDEEFAQGLVEMVTRQDEKDTDWVPAKRKAKENVMKGQLLTFKSIFTSLTNFVTKGRPTTYVKGPDVMSKSSRTARRYVPSWKGQTSLDKFNFGTTNLPATRTPFKNALPPSTCLKVPEKLPLSTEATPFDVSEGYDGDP